MSLTWVSDLFRRLQKLRLNNSIIPSMGDISGTLVQLRFLSLSHCAVTSPDGVDGVSAVLEELSLAFNRVSDVSHLMDLPKLCVVDLEENCIARAADVESLACCPAPRALTLAGNRAAAEDYRADVMSRIPQLVDLDEKRLRPRESRSRWRTSRRQGGAAGSSGPRRRPKRESDHRTDRGGR
jgi:hypothetical protein